MGSAIATVSVQSPEQVKHALQNITNKRTPQSVVYLQTIQHVDTSNVSAYPTHTATMRNPKMAAGRYEEGGKVGPLGPSTPSVPAFAFSDMGNAFAAEILSIRPEMERTNGKFVVVCFR